MTMFSKVLLRLSDFVLMKNIALKGVNTSYLANSKSK